MRAILCLALAACTLQGKTILGSGSSTTPTTTSSTGTSGAKGSDVTDADRERAEQGDWHAQQGQSNLDASSFLRAEFEALTGLTVEKAKAQAKQRGHSGEIEVTVESHFVEGCKDGLVCRATDQGGGQSGMGNGDMLRLWVNKKLAIAPPPD